MKNELFESILRGTEEAKAYMDAAREGYKVHVPETVDVRGIRAGLKMSQARFAESFGLSVDVVRHWESGRRTPETPARVLLKVIAHSPQAVREALAQETPVPAPATPGSANVGKSGRPRRTAGAVS